MTYPDVRYTGEGGEASAWLRRADAGPDLHVGANPVDYLATGGTTGGLLGLYRWTVAAGPGGALPHFHRSFAESFYVLAGDMELYDGTAWVPAAPGDFMFVPPGGLHGFRNAGDDPAHLLVLFAPGAPREGYFEGLAGLATMSEEEQAAFFELHDNHYVEE